jgi:two-component system, sensor histidine kinase YesM
MKLRRKLLLLKYFSNLSIQNKLIFSYFLVIFFPLIILGFFTYNTATSSLKAEVSKYSIEVVQQLNDNIDNTISELDRILSVLATDEDVLKILNKDRKRSLVKRIADDEIMNNKINNMVSFRTNIAGLYIFSFNGEVYNYKEANNSIQLGYTFVATHWYETMKTLNLTKLLLPTHIQEDILSSGPKKQVFTLIRKINDIDTKKNLGNILIDIDMTTFQNAWANINRRNYSELAIIDNNKSTIFNTNEKLVSTQLKGDYIDRILKEKNGTFITDVIGNSSLISYNTSKSTNWTVISIIPLTDIYQNINNLQYIIVSTVIFFIVVSFIIVVLISRSITKPISTLRLLMKRVESGNFNVSIPVRNMDEVGELSLSFNKMISKINNLIQTVYETQLLKKEAELNALQTQINPHFLYNTLQIIDLIAEEEGISEISSVCQSLSRIFRYSIKGSEVVSLSFELDHIKDYILIHKLRFADKFDVFYDIDESLYDKKMIKLLLQPLVENALFHGIENKKGKSILTISAKLIEDLIELVVEDTGIGMDEQQLEQLKESLNEEVESSQIDGYSRRSIGIKNVNSRIKLYFGEKYGITVDSKLKVGTKVTVTIPAYFHKDGGKSYGT